MAKTNNIFIAIKNLPLHNVSLIDGKKFKSLPKYDFELPKGEILIVNSIVVNDSVFGTNTEIIFTIKSDKNFEYSTMLFDDNWQDYLLQGKAAEVLYGRKDV